MIDIEIQYNQDKLTVRHHGGGHKKRYRVIDFKRIKDDSKKNGG